MNILIFSELYIEVGRPLLRASWADYFLKVVIRNMVAAYQERHISVTVTFIGNEKLVAHLQSKQLEDINFKTVSATDLASVYPNHVASFDLYRAAPSKSAAMASLVKTALGEHYAPDLIVSLTTSDWLSKVYDAPNIFYEAGLFSRAPFPALTQWDPSPNHWREGFVWKYRDYFDTLNDCGLDAPRQRVLDRLRDHYASGLRAKILSREALDPDHQFDYVVLLPLQYSNCIAFNACCDFESQISLLHAAMQAIDPRIGVVVTTHNYYENPITKTVDRQLRAQYPNYIRTAFCESEEAASQFLLPHVDAVVGVSTAVCLQALFWKKPVFIVGDSYMNAFAEGSLDQLYSTLASASFTNRDAALYWLITHYFLPLSRCIDGQFLRQHLENLVALERGEITIDAFKPPMSEGEALHLMFEKFSLAGQERDPDANRFRGEQIFYRSVLQHEVVSFDIFDTLIVRPFSKPAHLFALMQPQVDTLLGSRSPSCFMTERVHAEVEIARRITRREDVTLDEIYDALAIYLRLTPDEARQIKALEVELEVRLVKPRAFVRNILEFARLSDKRVVLVSDMYLPQAVIRQMLQQAGYPDDLEIYLSCEVMKTKTTGALFDHVLKREGVAPEKILHIGDNRHADIAVAQRKGIHTLYAPKATDRFLEYPRFVKLFTKSMNVRTTRDYWHNFMPNSVVAGLYANRLGDNPYDIFRTFDNKPNLDSVSGGSPRRLGYFLGPMFFGFVAWLAEKQKAAGADHILFLSRDGHLPYLIYQQLQKTDPTLPSASYFYCSRRLLGLASIHDVADIAQVIRNSSFKEAPVAQLLEKKFGIALDEVAQSAYQTAGFSGPFDPVKQDYMALLDPRLAALVQSLGDMVLQRAQAARATLRQQAALQGIEAHSRVGVVDVGCSTVMQNYLERALQLQHRTNGCYFVTNHRAFSFQRMGIQSSGYIAELEDQNCDTTPYFNNIELFETLFSAPHGSVMDLHADADGTLQPVLLDDGCHRKNAIVAALHDGAMDFVSDYLTVLGHQLLLTFMSRKMATNFAFEFVTNPGLYDALLFAGVEFENDYGGFANVAIVAEPDTATLRLPADFDKTSAWKPAVKSIQAGFALLAAKQSSLAPVPNGATAARAAVNTPAKQATPNDGKPSRFARKMAKLKKNPHGYFKDSKYPALRILRHVVPRNARFG